MVTETNPNVSNLEAADAFLTVYELAATERRRHNGNAQPTDYEAKFELPDGMSIVVSRFGYEHDYYLNTGLRSGHAISRTEAVRLVAACLTVAHRPAVVVAS